MTWMVPRIVVLHWARLSFQFACVLLRHEHVGGVPTEEVPLRTEASLVCLEREDHAATVSDGLCDVEIGLFPNHSERSTRTG